TRSVAITHIFLGSSRKILKTFMVCPRLLAAMEEATKLAGVILEMPDKFTTALVGIVMRLMVKIYYP
ncbi:MAG: hypothetical protein ABH882_00885, partial [Candidatus Omnitrophota bacterium]